MPYRYLAGAIEVALKAHFTDKTNWRNMLRNETNDELNLASFQQSVRELLPQEFEEYYTPNTPITEVVYPVLNYPKKVKSISLDKQPEITSRLTGIRGQYWLLGDGRVFNIRKHSGYFIQLSVG